jgi:hypothetical protein
MWGGKERLSKAGVTRESKNLERNIKEGWLSKHSVSAPTVLKNWRKRYVVLMPNQIVWCDKPGTGVQEGKMMILPRNRTTVAVNKGKELTIRIVNGSELKLRAMDAVIAEEWRKAILLASDGEPDDNDIPSKAPEPSPRVPIAKGSPEDYTPNSTPVSTPRCSYV